MISTTECPSCHTHFKVTEDQLSAQEGLVRCGRCKTVFNALEQAQNDLQLALPIDIPKSVSSTPAADINLPPASTPAAKSDVPLSNNQVHEPIEPVNDAININIIKELEESAFRPKKRHKNFPWLWIVANFMLLLALGLQVIYFLRVEIAAQAPRFKPALSLYCRLLHCSLPLPHQINLFSIESSDLAADTTAPNLIILSAILRNLAPYAQAFPAIELTLTNGEKKLLARRLFKPADYLKPEENQAIGLANSREIEVQLRLDTQDLKPAGYKLLLLYPPETTESVAH